MPGVNRLAAELGVNRKTVEVALCLLEREGLLAGQGPGRKRRIILPREASPVRPLRVAILLSEAADRKVDYMAEAQHELIDAGHTVVFPAKSLAELDFDVKRVARLVAQTQADAWIVVAGSRDVIEWFVESPVPAFALFGHRRGLPVAGAGPEKLPALQAATQALIELGHRRIVLIMRRIHRVPQPGVVVSSYLAALADGGIKTSDYNLPDWDESREGFQACLEALFRVTPPTAMIISETPLFAAVQQFLAGRGIRVPKAVSLISTDPHPHFSWCVPSVAHIHWDAGPVVRHIVRWASSVSRGRADLKQSFVAAEYVPGGTVGPAPSHSLSPPAATDPSS